MLPIFSGDISSSTIAPTYSESAEGLSSSKLGISGIFEAVFFHSGSLSFLILDDLRLFFELLRSTTEESFKLLTCSLGWGITSGLFLFTGISGYFYFCDFFLFCTIWLKDSDRSLISLLAWFLVLDAILAIKSYFSLRDMLALIGFSIYCPKSGSPSLFFLLCWSSSAKSLFILPAH